MKYDDVAYTENHKWNLITTPYNIASGAGRWCTTYKSAGRFYRRMYHPHRIRWYFEKEEDAILFALKWK